MSTSRITAYELVDKAIEELGPIRRRYIKRRMRNPQFREALMEEVLVEVCEDCDCPDEFKHHCESFGFEMDQALELDWEAIKKIIKLIIKYLPTILKVLAIFLHVPAIFLAAVLIPSMSTPAGAVDVPAESVINYYVSN